MLEKQYFIPEPEEFIAESPMTATLKQMKEKQLLKTIVEGIQEKKGKNNLYIQFR